MKKVRYLFSIVIISLVWTMLFVLFKTPTIPRIDKVFISLINAFKDKKFLINLFSTLKIVFWGTIISVSIGFGLGILINMFSICKLLLEPTILLIRNVPPITLFPIILIMFGIKDISRIIIIVWVAMPPIMIATIDGLKNVNHEIVEACSLEANKWQTLLYVKIPMSLPNLFIGLKSSVGAGFCAIVTAEMLGANKGIGYMILYSTNTYKYSFTYAYILIVVLLGFIFDLIFNLIIKILSGRFM